jgi:predicted nucleotide-binding protein (sugar kinase/HSP70/actin superfamily)
MLQPSTPAVPSGQLRLLKRRDIEEEIRKRTEAERARLELKAGLRSHPGQQFQRPVERPFTPAERDRVTVLFGGLTWKHEWLLKSVFQANGYQVEILPIPDVASFQIGKEFGNNGQCNPTYFTVGHLIKYLQALEAQGLSRQEIADRYMFVTAGSCGPCRFGMYEAEYRLGVENAGFTGFRVIVIQQNDGMDAGGDTSGLELTTDFRLGAFGAINIGDVLNDVANQIRPYEVETGETDRVFQRAMADLTTAMRDRRPFDVTERVPAWLAGRLAARPSLREAVDTLGKIYDHFYGRGTMDALRAARDRLDAIEVDRLRVKPLVKITGEFWAQTTEGDGNFHMFRFLEREGAQVLVEPVANWIMYLIWQAREQAITARGLDGDRPAWWQLHRRLAGELRFRKAVAGYSFGQWVYSRQYARLVNALGGLAHPLLDQDDLARVARPYYHRLARGGEGHLEVGKNIYYSVKKKCHMVLSLKPFGCMPSTQSDGVQSAVMSHFKDMIFLPIETSGEGEINAHSRVQMGLGEAKVKARTEFQHALEATGKRLDDIRRFVDDHPPLRRPFYPVPHREGVAGTAATFVLHVSDLMDRRTPLRAVPGMA